MAKRREEAHQWTREGLLRALAFELDFYHHETLVDGLSHVPDMVLERLEKEWRLAHGRRRRAERVKEAQCESRS